jgi:2-polyprenyl-3-methyl-5-hydroxy-6-metoxy-1,4-benzoquinol methylase
VPQIPTDAAAARALTTRGGDLCPVCGTQTRARIDLGDYRLHACGGCGSWSSDALARGARTSFEPEAYFSNAAADHARWSELLARVSRGGAPPGSILDVGCGRGDFLRFAAERLPQARRAGIELDSARAAEARAADPAAQIETGDAATALRGIPGNFTLVTLWDVFEHLEDPGAVLRDLAERLAPGGALFVQTIHEHSIVPALGRWAYAWSAGRVRGPARRTHEAHHLVFFSRRGLEGLARAAGLRVRDLWFDRLARARMDGPALVTAATAALLAVENALGNGLFVNLVLERADD